MRHARNRRGAASELAPRAIDRAARQRPVAALEGEASCTAIEYREPPGAVRSLIQRH